MKDTSFNKYLMGVKGNFLVLLNLIGKIVRKIFNFFKNIDSLKIIIDGCKIIVLVFFKFLRRVIRLYSPQDLDNSYKL